MAKSKNQFIHVFFWQAIERYRHWVIFFLVSVLFVSALLLSKEFIRMESRIKELSAYEAIYVFSINKDLELGDIISRDDLTATLFFENEFNRIENLFQVVLEPQKQQILNSAELVGRVLKVPVFKDQLLRKEQLAEVGATPGLSNLLKENHSLLDVSVAQEGFNIFIRPNDKVDLYQTDKYGSKLIAENIEVMLVDSQALGKAPFRAEINKRAERNLSLSIPNSIFKKVLAAKSNSSLLVTYHKSKLAQPVKKIVKPKIEEPVTKRDFQSLVLISGDKKEFLDE